jgi:hypothetical protein
MAKQRDIAKKPTPEQEERIRQRAHELYLLRGCAEGSAEQDWTQAEAEVLGEQAPPAAKKTAPKRARKKEQER